MSISEAVNLVLCAGFLSKKNIFILDMGQPVNITSIAEKLIKLSGLRPTVGSKNIEPDEIQIVFTGNQGEKLHEELFQRDC